MRLLKVELKRFWARRLTWVAFVGLVGITIVSAVGTFFSLAPPSEAEQRYAETSYQQYYDDWKANSGEWYQQCLTEEAAEREANGGETYDWECENHLDEPQKEDWLWFHPPFSDEVERGTEGYGAMLGFAALIVGASFFAAEMATGAISNWLTFEPRRTRVYVSKIGAAALGIIPIAVTTLAVSIAGMWLVYAARDLIGSPTADMWRAVTLVGLRITILMAAAAIIGSALGAVTRHTAAVIGLAVAWVVIDQMVYFGILPRFQQWSGLNNMQAWIAGGTTYYSEKCTLGADGRVCESVEATLSMAHGGGYLAVATVLITAVGLLIFRRRDVA